MQVRTETEQRAEAKNISREERHTAHTKNKAAEGKSHERRENTEQRIQSREYRAENTEQTVQSRGEVAVLWKDVCNFSLLAL
jgi:hypothetical protein